MGVDDMGTAPGEDQMGGADTLAPVEKNNQITTNGTKSPPADQAPILVLINPHSGRGKSVKIFKKHILRLLEERDIRHEVFVTTAELRIREYLLAQKDLTKYRAIMVVAGDGLLHEAVNALVSRPDWQQVSDIPIGVIPTGSGNGLAYTLLDAAHEPVKNQTEAVRACCERVIKAQKSPCDLVRIRFGGETVWSFLSIGWGLLADIDIDSEWLRCLGEFRFTIYGVLRALTSVSYKGRLSFRMPAIHPDDELAQRLEERLKSDSYVTQLNNDIDEDSNSRKKRNDDPSGGSDWVHIEDKFTCLYAVHQSHVNSTTKFSPRSSLTDNLTYLTYIRGSLSIYQTIEFLLAIEDGSHEKLPYVRTVPVDSFEFQPLQASKVVVDGEVIPWKLSDGVISAKVMSSMLKLAWNPAEEV